jgi:hypothetical protein
MEEGLIYGQMVTTLKQLGADLHKHHTDTNGIEIK